MRSNSRKAQCEENPDHMSGVQPSQPDVTYRPKQFLVLSDDHHDLQLLQMVISVVRGDFGTNENMDLSA